MQSLTTVADLDANQLKYLAQLELLESLDIGDCVTWTRESDYQVLAQLRHLRHLRLEQGPSESVFHHLASLEQMPTLNHLELVNFTMNTSMERWSHIALRRLLIIPRYSPAVIESLSLITISLVFR